MFVTEEFKEHFEFIKEDLTKDYNKTYAEFVEEVWSWFSDLDIPLPDIYLKPVSIYNEGDAFCIDWWLEKTNDVILVEIFPTYMNGFINNYEATYSINGNNKKHLTYPLPKELLIALERFNKLHIMMEACE